MKCSRIRSGFTLVEILVVVSIMAILLALLLPVIRSAYTRTQYGAAHATMKSIQMALEGYHSVCDAYPPDDVPNAGGAEALWYHLCRRQADGAIKFEQLLSIPPEYLRETSGGNKAVISPLGGKYAYAVLVDPDGQKRSCVVIDPGKDKLLGGTLSKEKGFIPDETIDENGDRKPDCADNVYSTPPIIRAGQ